MTGEKRKEEGNTTRARGKNRSYSVAVGLLAMHKNGLSALGPKKGEGKKALRSLTQTAWDKTTCDKAIAVRARRRWVASRWPKRSEEKCIGRASSCLDV